MIHDLSLPAVRVPRRARGFTLLELIVAIAVMGILATLAVPAFQYVAATSKIKSAASNLHMSLLKARSEAVKRDADVTLTATGGAWQNGWTMTAGGNTLQSQEALKGVTVVATETTVTFQSSGRVAAGSARTFDVAPAYRNESERVGDSVEGDLQRCITLGANGSASIRQAAC